MATLETQILDDVVVRSRRKMLSLGGAALAGLAFTGTKKAQAQSAITDSDILNFALNLEYLEAQFYNLAVYGVTIDQLPTPVAVSVNGAAAGTVVMKPNFAKVPFTDAAIQAYATETAAEEAKHVSFLQSALGTAAVSMPNIDLYNSFNTLAAASNIAPSFDPFASDAFFLLGAYIFEDVGVSAYHGAAPLIQNKAAYLPAAVGIHAVEAYHAGLVRFSINRIDAGTNVLTGITQQISAKRSQLANAANPTIVDDIGIMNTTVALQGTTATFPVTTIVDDNLGTGASPGRTSAQVIQIVTGGSATNQGAFFPNGLNGTIK